MTSNTPPDTFVSPGSVLPNECNKDIVAGYVYKLKIQDYENRNNRISPAENEG